MEFLEGDAVIVRIDGRRGIVLRVQHNPPPPYQVRYDDNAEQEWLHENEMMLACNCDIVRGGCVCGAAKREKENAS